MLDAWSDQIAVKLGLTREAVDARLIALDLTLEKRERLKNFVPHVEARVDSFLDRLYLRFKAYPEIGALLGSDIQIERLKIQQRGYLLELFGVPIDWPYVLDRVAIGIVHHRIKLTPQWFLSTYSHFVTEMVPMLLDAEPAPEKGLDLVLTFLKSVLFDATVVLDSYGMAEELRLQGKGAGVARSQPEFEGMRPPEREGRHDGEAMIPSIPRSRLTTSSVEMRREYIGITREHEAVLRGLGRAFSAALPGMLEDFYSFFTQHPETATMVPGEIVPRLQQQVYSYWQEFSEAAFDRPYAASRMRIGVVHERIGLAPQWYVLGLSRQVDCLLRTLVPNGANPRSTIDAFMRALFFDLTFVLDAYMEARAQTVLRTEGYAHQLVAGLTSGVVVIDGDRRVVSVNQALLDYLRLDSSLVYRVPLEQAVPVPELGALLDTLSQSAHPKCTVMGRLGSRVCRISAVRLDRWTGIRGNPVALVIDDVSEILEHAVNLQDSNLQLAAIAQAVDAVMWELDTESHTLLMISAGVLELLGYRDIYFIGRPDAWIKCIHPTDRESFVNACANIPVGTRTIVEHRMVRADGREIWVRTSLRKECARRSVHSILGVSFDVTNERVSEQRQAALDMAIAREQAKSEMLSVMGHEIRTPLNGVVGMLDVLLATEIKGEVAGHVQTAHTSALELVALLNDLLDLSKLDSGMLAVHRDRFSLSMVIDGVRALFEPQAKARGISLRIDVASHLVPGWIGDALRIRQVLSNLLSNAVRFTDSGEVLMRVEKSSEGLCFVVQDSGIGVPPDKRSSLFQPFAQAHQGRGGTGLGLSISKRMAEAMGGTLTYAPGVRHGSQFTLTVPLGPAADEFLPEGRGRVVVLSVSEEYWNILQPRLLGAGWNVSRSFTPEVVAFFSMLNEPRPAAIGGQPVFLCAAQAGERSVGGVIGMVPLNEASLISALSSLNHTTSVASVKFQGRVLVAEDNQVNQKVATLMLERIGFQVDVVSDGRAALTAAQQQKYALIFMDMMMPEMDGVEASTLILADGLNRNTPIIALTANSSSQGRSECSEAGMVDMLAKPLQLAALRSIVAKYVVAA